MQLLSSLLRRSLKIARLMRQQQSRMKGRLQRSRMSQLPTWRRQHLPTQNLSQLQLCKRRAKMHQLKQQ